MSVLRAQVRFARDTGAGEDISTNTWHFKSPDFAVDVQDAQTLVDGLETFYNAIDGYLSSFISPFAEVRVYDLEEAEPRAPILTDTIELAGLSSTNGVPAECAIVLSHRGDVPSGAVRARRQGRIYLGPINGSAIEAGTGDMRVVALCRTDIANAAVAVSELTAPDTRVWTWSVWSQRTRSLGGSVNDSAFPVVAGFIDNAVDIQRRRGIASTARTTFTT